MEGRVKKSIENISVFNRKDEYHEKILKLDFNNDRCYFQDPQMVNKVREHL